MSSQENSQEASINPPLLKFCDNLLVQLLFLERYDDYWNLDGDISLFHVIKNRLDGV
jgi:hypothetical protein